MVASALLLAPAALIDAPRPSRRRPAGGVAALGLLGTGVAFAIFFELIRTVGPARAFVVTYIASAFAIVYGPRCSTSGSPWQRWPGSC